MKEVEVMEFGVEGGDICNDVNGRRGRVRADFLLREEADMVERSGEGGKERVAI